MGTNEGCLLALPFGGDIASYFCLYFGIMYSKGEDEGIWGQSQPPMKGEEQHEIDSKDSPACEEGEWQWVGRREICERRGLVDFFYELSEVGLG